MKKIVEDIQSKYACSKCNYTCTTKSHWIQHLATRKHKWKQMETLKTKNRRVYIVCFCGKKYKSRSGFYKHEQICKTVENKKAAEDNKKITELTDFCSNPILDILKRLGEKDKQIAELQENTQLTVTNNNNITINLFLNEYCKDAMNLTDFVDNLQV